MKVIMKTTTKIFSLLTLLPAILISGCSQSSSSSSSGSGSSALLEKVIYSGDLELSKKTPVQITVGETNNCTFSTMALPGDILNLDVAIETKGSTAAPNHISVTTRVGQQFTLQLGNITYGYTAKLKAE